MDEGTNGVEKLAKIFTPIFFRKSKTYRVNFLANKSTKFEQVPITNSATTNSSSTLSAESATQRCANSDCAKSVVKACEYKIEN
jgi:hypothetical protein